MDQRRTQGDANRSYIGKRENQQQHQGEPVGAISGAPSNAPPKPYPHPLVGQRTKEGAKTEGARPERPLLQLQGGPAAPEPPSQPHPRAQGGGGSGAEDEGDAGLTARRREPAMEGGRGEAPGRCGPAATSIGGAVARRPRWRSGLASPRWSSAATHSRSWQRCGGAGRSRGAWPDAREGRADPDAEPRGRTTRRHAGPMAPPWRCGTRRGRRAAPPWSGQGRGRSFCCWLTTTATRIRGIRGAS